MGELMYQEVIMLMKRGPEGLFRGYPLLKKEAEEDNTDAQIQLGMIFEGLGCAHLGEPFSLMHNYQLAYQWYKIAADCNSPEGLYHCGRIAYLGRIGDADKRHAPAFWNKAVELGSRKSAFCLAKLYLRGEYVEQDIKQAYILCVFSRALPESEKLLNYIISSNLLDLGSLSYLNNAADKFVRKYEELKAGGIANPTILDDSGGISEWEMIVEKLSGI